VLGTASSSADWGEEEEGNPLNWTQVKSDPGNLEQTQEESENGSPATTEERTCQGQKGKTSLQIKQTGPSRA